MARKKLELPLTVIGPADVGRLMLEMERLDEALRAAALRSGGEVKMPKTSRPLDDVAEINKLDLLTKDDRQQLKEFLVSVRDHAPVIHISFASEPSAAFTLKIVEWMRSNIARYLLVQVGLQPSIAAGCVVRTTNKVFDMSLRRYLDSSSGLLLEALRKQRPQNEARVNGGDVK